MAERVCGRDVCFASASRGVGRMGGRAKGCAKYAVFPSNDFGVREICGGEIRNPKPETRKKSETRSPKEVGGAKSIIHQSSSFALLHSLAVLLQPWPDEQA